jgi:hypothetical protein
MPAIGLCKCQGVYNNIVVIEERGRFNRERSSGSYGTLPYFFATTAASIPFQILVSFAFGSISYW